MRTPRIPLLALLLAFASASVSAQTTSFLGTQVSPLGNATLSMAGTSLQVGNIGSSGDDGVRMLIGGGSGATIQSNNIATMLPVGGEIIFEASNGMGINPCCHITHSSASMFETMPDALTIGDYDLTVLSAGVPVASYKGMSGPISTSMAPVEFVVDLLSLETPLPDPIMLPAVEPFPISEAFSLRWSSDVAFMDGAGGPLGTGDEVIITLPPGTDMNSVDHVDVRAMTPLEPTFEVDFDGIYQHHHGRTSDDPTNGGIVIADQGRAKLTVQGGMQGTLRMLMDEAETGLHLMWTTPGGASAGDTDMLSVQGELITSSVVDELGTVVVLCNGASWDVTPDFSGSGSPDATVELLDESGHVLGINPCTLGPITVMTNEWANLTGVEDNNIALEIGFPTPVPMNLPGVGLITASRIKMHSNASKKYRYFAIVDRTVLSALGGDFIVDTEPNMFMMSDLTSMPEFSCLGTLTGKRVHGPIVIKAIDPAGMNGVDITPTGTPDQFGVQWAPLGPPSATMGETDWAFVSRLASDIEPVERMRVRLMSDGSAVHLYKQSGLAPNAEFQVIVKNGGAVVTEFMHAVDGDPILDLTDWPIAAGYKLLQSPDQPWSIWIDLGYPTPVSIPGAPAPGGDAAALPPPFYADLVEVIANNVGNPGPPDLTRFAGSFFDIEFIIVVDTDPKPVAVSQTPPIAESVLHPAYPNPFNPQTTLAFELKTAGEVSLDIYAVDGSFVATVFRGTLPVGAYTYAWDGLDQHGQRVASGVYLAKLRTRDGQGAVKLSLLK